MGFLHQWHDKAAYCLVGKQMSAAVMIDTVDWHFKICQESPI